MGDTVILTMSEFGRAVAENGNRGTDHGHGNAMLVMGGGVKGGHVYGKWPGLGHGQRYEGRDLAVTTDFRDVFAEIVTTHLGVVDAGPIFPGYTLESSNRAVSCCSEAFRPACRGSTSGAAALMPHLGERRTRVPRQA